VSPPVDPASPACADDDEAAPDCARVAPLPVGASGSGSSGIDFHDGFPVRFDPDNGRSGPNFSIAGAKFSE
jgi:hypothetical protein